MDDGLLAEIAAGFKIDASGRVELWRGRMEQDRVLLAAVRERTPVPPVPHAVEVPGAGPETDDGATSSPAAWPVTGQLSWDRSAGQTCTDRVEQALARIDQSGDLNAFTRIFPREALAQARELDARLASGEKLGPFAGAIVAVKDIMGVRGVPITCGTAAFEAEPGEDSFVVARLRAAGGIIIGTANLHALAYGPFSTSSDFGPVRNPLNTAVVAGGSSGGSAAAVAAGLADIAIGTDTAGSIRMPAALCGLVGVKPSYSLVPTAGAQPLAGSLDHIGPLARTVADAHAALNAMLGADHTVPGNDQGANAHLPLAGITIGLVNSYVDKLLTEQVRLSFEQAIELVQSLGARIKLIHLPTLAAAPGIMLCTLGPEAFHTFRELLMHRGHLLPPDVRLRLETGMFVSEADQAHCQLLRRDLRDEVDGAFGHVDAIFMPTMAVTAPLLSEVAGIANSTAGGPVRAGMNVLTLPFNLTGHPALTLPFTHDDRGAGIGMQLVGAHFEDARLLSLASVLEAHIARIPAMSPTPAPVQAPTQGRHA